MQNIGTEQVPASGRVAWMQWGIVLLMASGASGCAQFNKLKSRMGHPPTTTVVAPAPVPAPSAPAEAPAPASLASIVNDQLQLGHYAEGERQLRSFLREHPDDRTAQALLRQLTADPEQVLGHAARDYVVQAGDSYSTLAGRYLGDAGRFLILARYNGSTNPSLLRAGQRLRLPAAASRLGATSTSETASDEASAAAPVDASAASKARRLQGESVALLHQGQQAQALTRMDEALDADPQLPPSGADAQALRKQLVAVYHQRAIVLYRDQQLDQAIALWNRVLAIEPDFEPATAYRARALELKQRLKQY